MTLEEAFTKFQQARGHADLPWMTSKQELLEVFTAGWHAHYESTRQVDMFPGTLCNDVTPPCSDTVTADDIYACYPRKVNPKGAKKAIRKAFGPGALDRPEYILAKTKEFAAAVKSWPEAERKFIAHPQTWFNAGGWLTDPKEWVRGAAAAPSQFTRKYE